MGFVRNPTRPGKSKQPFQFCPSFERFLQEILPDHENRTNLLNFDPFFMVFAKIQLGLANQSKLFNFDPFWNGFVRNPTRLRKSEQHFEF